MKCLKRFFCEPTPNANMWKLLPAARYLRKSLGRFPTHNEYRCWMEYLSRCGIDYVCDKVLLHEMLQNSWRDVCGILFVKCSFCGDWVLKRYCWTQTDDGEYLCSIWCENEYTKAKEW